jgi:hypothetical protein
MIAFHPGGSERTPMGFLGLYGDRDKAAIEEIRRQEDFKVHKAKSKGQMFCLVLFALCVLFHMRAHPVGWALIQSQPAGCFSGAS